ncbi:hypothetical protein BpHYR1_048623 [Brachionus plicatilis]|uniref:Uncharacterized protein n=1 Tax=Brachionus plicatilis TaxID=10195 RepID=A0A3M7RLX0_BRAPC|nr:hypothetical protein BpHYR1_048623 [Brachionus plicatilis]
MICFLSPFSYQEAFEHSHLCLKLQLEGRRITSSFWFEIIYEISCIYN